jgi:hypothetical protein
VITPSCQRLGWSASARLEFAPGGALRGFVIVAAGRTVAQDK